MYGRGPEIETFKHRHTPLTCCPQSSLRCDLTSLDTKAPAKKKGKAKDNKSSDNEDMGLISVVSVEVEAEAGVWRSSCCIRRFHRKGDTNTTYKYDLLEWALSVL